MKVLGIKYLKDLSISDVDKFEVTLDNNTKKDIDISIVWRPKQLIKSLFNVSIKDNFGNIDNMNDAFSMFCEELNKSKICQYKFDELLYDVKKKIKE